MDTRTALDEQVPEKPDETAPAESAQDNAAKPLPDAARAFTFNVLWALAVVGNCVGAVLNYTIWSGGIIFTYYYELMDTFATVWLSAGVSAFGIIVTLACYYTSLDHRRPRRPAKRLHVLWM